MSRTDRKPNQLRNVHIICPYNKHAEGSTLIECGDTRVICTASIEEKIPLSNSESTSLIYFLKKNGLSDLYPARTISSNYLESKDFDLFKSSEEGTLPRKKIRLRSYPKDESIRWKLEKKISSVEGRFKTSDLLSDADRQKIKSFGYFDNLYGNYDWGDARRVLFKFSKR